VIGPAARTVVLVAALVLPTSAAACRSDTPTDRGYLALAWNAYRSTYIQPAGYVLDRTRNDGEVTSEGQAYALMQAAWMDDQATFNRVWAWTVARLQRPDGLFSWRWSPAAGGRVLDVNTATDADEDIAFALLVASQRFSRPDLVEQARTVLRAIHTHARIEVAGRWFPSAGNWAPAERIVNLSYFAPYAYPYFDRVDPGSRWMEVVPVGYDLLRQAIGEARTGLPADFLTVDGDGRIGPLPASSTLGRTFSFDGIRIPWRVDLDCRLHQRVEACGAGGALPGLLDTLRSTGRLVTAYDPAGAPLTTDQSLSFYGSLLPVLVAADPMLAAEVRRQHLPIDVLMAVVGDGRRYYDLNWIWFGLAGASGLVDERTPPLSAFAPATGAALDRPE